MVRYQHILWSMILFGIISLGNSGAKGYSQEREPDVRFVPTPNEVVMEMLKMARVNANDIVYDLGCGDGRFVITAAKVFGARGIGIDIDPVRIQESIENRRKAGIPSKATWEFRKGPLREITAGPQSVVYNPASDEKSFWRW